MKLSSSDRKSLAKLAASMPKGSAERRAILAGLKKKAVSFDDRFKIARKVRNAIVDALMLEGLGLSRRDGTELERTALIWTDKALEGSGRMAGMGKQVSEGLEDLNKAIQGGGMHLDPTPRQMKKIEKLVSQGASLKAIAKEVRDGGEGGDMKGAQKKLMDLVNSMVE